MDLETVADLVRTLNVVWSFWVPFQLFSKLPNKCMHIFPVFLDTLSPDVFQYLIKCKYLPSVDD